MLTRRSKFDQFFAAIQSWDFEKLELLLSQHSFQKQLKESIAPFAKTFEKHIDFILPTTTYADVLMEMAIKADQFNILEKLITAGCLVQAHHVRIAIKHQTSVQLKRCLIEHVNELHHKDIIKDALLNDDDTIINYMALFHWTALQKYKEESFNIIKMAIKQQAIKILEILFSQYNENIINLCSRSADKESLLDFAKKNGNACVQQYIEQQIDLNRRFTKENLNLPIEPLQLTDLLDYDVLPKGLALLLNYHYEKKSTQKKDPKVFFALGEETLLRAIQLFIESKEKTLTLLFARKIYNSMGGHRNAFRIEKYKDSIYIILMDSYNVEYSDFNDILYFLQQGLKKNMPEIFPRIIFCTNLTNQQTDGSHCSFFSLKNISKLLVTKMLAKEILEQHVIRTEKKYNSTCIFYRLPRDS